MSLNDLKLSALAEDHQVATIDPGGVLLNSCHSLLDLRSSIGGQFFELFEAFVGLEPNVMGLTAANPELCLPKVSAPEFGTDEHLDFRFRFKGEGRPILLLISAHKTVNDSLREAQQRRNETSIELEYQHEQDATLRAENGDLRKYAHVISHDLKAPLRAIGHLAGWIEEAIEADNREKVTEYIDLLRSRTQRMESLVEGILGYSLSGGSAKERSEVPTRELVNDIVQHDLADLGVTFDIDSQLPVIVGSSTAIRQVLSNLLSNAVKHGRPEGAVISVRASFDGGYYRFAVTDNGPGIKPEDQARIFKPFEVLSQTTSAVGTGLGLGIATNIVETAGGTMGVISEPGNGATFWFNWPIPRSPQKTAQHSDVISRAEASTHG